MILAPIPPEDLEHGAWYYGIDCSCGRRIVLHKDVFSGHGDDWLHLPQESEVACECGTHTRLDRLKKFKHSRRT